MNIIKCKSSWILQFLPILLQKEMVKWIKRNNSLSKSSYSNVVNIFGNDSDNDHDKKKIERTKKIMIKIITMVR